MQKNLFRHARSHGQARIQARKYLQQQAAKEVFNEMSRKRSFLQQGREPKWHLSVLLLLLLLSGVWTSSSIQLLAKSKTTLKPSPHTDNFPNPKALYYRGNMEHSATTENATSTTVNRVIELMCPETTCPHGRAKSDGECSIKTFTAFSSLRAELAPGCWLSSGHVRLKRQRVRVPCDRLEPAASDPEPWPGACRT